MRYRCLPAGGASTAAVLGIYSGGRGGFRPAPSAALQSEGARSGAEDFPSISPLPYGWRLRCHSPRLLSTRPCPKCGTAAHGAPTAPPPTSPGPLPSALPSYCRNSTEPELGAARLCSAHSICPPRFGLLTLSLRTQPAALGLSRPWADRVAPPNVPVPVWSLYFIVLLNGVYFSLSPLVDLAVTSEISSYP